MAKLSGIHRQHKGRISALQGVVSAIPMGDAQFSGVLVQAINCALYFYDISQ